MEAKRSLLFFCQNLKTAHKTPPETVPLRLMFGLLTESCFMCNMVDLGPPFDNPKPESSFHSDYEIYTGGSIHGMPKLLAGLDWHLEQSSVLIALIESRCRICTNNAIARVQLEVDASIVYPHMIVGIEDLQVDYYWK